MTKTFRFNGVAKWAKVREPTDPEKAFGKEQFEIVLYMDEANLAEFKASGSRLNIKTDEDGSFVRFARPNVKFQPWKKEHVVQGPPSVFIKDGNEWVEFLDDLIGNGSVVTIEVRVYDTRYGKGTELSDIWVHDLVPYVKGETNDSRPPPAFLDNTPAPASNMAAVEKPTKKLNMPF